MKKLIGIALWILALAIPFRFAILDTDDTVHADGLPNNAEGLISFLAMLTLFFIGYWLVDSSKSQGAESHGH